ncbi:MAG: 1-acyl-sn-glycerol-3-phosphate acyltransferase [Prevotella sp.]|nr:1-acyl-sn-glycerol-3-phosphate acyltransferase [Prevotella sp.]
MVKKLCRWILYRLWGWKIDVTVDRPNKYILCLAPHTTNWDLLLGELYAHAEGFQCQFLMKKEWFFGPLGAFFRKIGGIPVWRSKHTSMTENLAAIAKDSKSFHLCITPEGTRSLNPDWKKGFYVIAQKAELPILLYGVDYEKRIIRCTRSIIPSGDIDKDMRDIKLYYKDFKGKYPEKFTIGEL